MAGGEAKTVTITQEGANSTLNISQTDISVAATAGTGSFNITGNTGWTAASDQSWCNVSPASGTGNGTVHLTIAANPTAQQRRAAITVKTENSSKVVTVTQTAADGKLTVSHEKLDIAADGGEHSVNITSNTDWTVSCNADWCIASLAAGSGNGEFPPACQSDNGTAHIDCNRQDRE